MKDYLIFKEEFDWDKRFDKSTKREEKLNKLESIGIGMLIGAGGLFGFQVLLAIVDKL